MDSVSGPGPPVADDDGRYDDRDDEDDRGRGPVR